MNKIVKEEIDKRIIVENFFELNSINFIIEKFEKNDTTVIFECDICRNLGYLSQLVCKNCKKKCCLDHLINCKW